MAHYEDYYGEMSDSDSEDWYDFTLADGTEDWHDFALDDGKNKSSKRGSIRRREIGTSSLDSNDALGVEEEENYIPLAHQQSCLFKDICGFFFQREFTGPSFLSLTPPAYGVPAAPTLEFLPDQVDIIASSHGLLVCRDRTENNPYYVCNPATKNWKELPKPEYYHGPNSAHALAVEKEGNYQLVCAVRMMDQPIVCFEIYSSEAESWKCSDTVCVDLEDFSFEGVGFCMKGMAYWMTSKMQVLAFDLKNEVYGIIPLPSESTPSGGVLTQIHDELAYISVSEGSGNNYVIEMCCGYDLSLRQDIHLQLGSVLAGFGGYRILPCIDGDKLMILLGGDVYSYRLSDGEIEMISSENGVEWPVTAKFLPYVSSLIREV